MDEQSFFITKHPLFLEKKTDLKNILITDYESLNRFNYSVKFSLSLKKDISFIELSFIDYQRNRNQKRSIIHLNLAQ